MTPTGMAKAREAAGGKDADIAKVLGISAAAVSRWEGIVPPSRAIELEEKLAGKITRYDIRPDFFGDPPRRRQRKAAA